jgi:two-component system, chemotaxis family, protein-glutamate methylesterase/glutaminase
MVTDSARSAGPSGASPPRTVVAVGASLGGIAALREVLGGLPASFPAAVLVVQHLDPRAVSRLAAVLAPSTALRVAAAAEGEAMREGTVYLALPNRHLGVDAAGALRLTDGPRVNFVRPSADVLFVSVAEEFSGRVVAVVLTGRHEDGAVGVVRVHERGGVVIVQDPAGAMAAGMPESSIRTGTVDHVLALDQIAPALVRLAEQHA